MKRKTSKTPVSTASRTKERRCRPAPCSASVLAEKIRKDLMTMGGGGEVATRLALMQRQPDGSEIELGGANEVCVRSIIFRHLDGVMPNVRGERPLP